MANIEKHKAYEVGRILLHNNRTENDGVEHSNESIDNERTALNYHFKKGSVDSLKERLSEVFIMKRKDQAVMASIIVTLPDNVKQGDEYAFFSAVYDFCKKDFGEENIINAVVHNDEITPHIHIDFAPVVKGDVNFSHRGSVAVKEWKEQHEGKLERLCCKERINKKYLHSMHPRMNQFVKEQLGYEVSILNGATEGGNKTIQQLKNLSLKAENEKTERQIQNLRIELDKIKRYAESIGLTAEDVGLLPLMQKLDDLQNQNEVLKDIILRNGYSYSAEDIEQLKSKRYIPSKSSSVNVYNGSLVQAEIPPDAVVVIELYKKRPRPLPQQELIEQNREIRAMATYAVNSPETVVRKDSKTDKKTFLFVKTDNAKQTVQALFDMEQRLREDDLINRKLYIDKFETDKYDLARSILTELDVNASYYTRSELQKKSEQKEQDLNRQRQ